MYHLNLYLICRLNYRAILLSSLSWSTELELKPIFEHGMRTHSVLMIKNNSKKDWRFVSLIWRIFWQGLQLSKFCIVTLLLRDKHSLSKTKYSKTVTGKRWLSTTPSSSRIYLSIQCGQYLSIMNSSLDSVNQRMAITLRRRSH